MKRKNLIVSLLAATAIVLTGCGEPSATQVTCDKIGELYESVDGQWLPKVTEGIKDRDVARQAQRVADSWADIAFTTQDDDLGALMSQLQPVFDQYADYAAKPMGDHPKDDPTIQQVWQESSAAIGEVCSG